MKRIMFGLVAGIVMLIVIGPLWITRMRANAIVHPGRGAITRAPESVGITNYQDVTFKSADGLALKGWWVAPQNGAVVILVHGHGGTRQGQLDDAGILAGRGYGALLFDLRNSGESEGNVTTFGLLEVNDVRGGIDFVLAQPGVDPNRIGLLGQSMGGATAIMAGARIPEVRAVAALSAYTSMEDNIETGVENLAGLPTFPFAPLVIFWGEWEAGIDIQQVAPAAEIASISPRPILIVHGERDDLIPVENAHALYAAAREPKELLLIPNAAHESFYPVAGDAYAEKLVAFFAHHLTGK